MSDPIREYLDCLRSYDQKRLKAAVLIGIVESVAEGLNEQPSAFVEWHNRSARFQSKSGLPMVIEPDKWPDRNVITTTIGDWNVALLKLRDAWTKVPQTYRHGLKGPPPTLLIGL